MIGSQMRSQALFDAKGRTHKLSLRIQARPDEIKDLLSIENADFKPAEKREKLELSVVAGQEGCGGRDEVTTETTGADFTASGMDQVPSLKQDRAADN